MKKTFLIALVLIAFSCEKEGHTDITIRNRSSKSIVFANLMNIDTILCYDSALQQGISKFSFARMLILDSMSEEEDFMRVYHPEVWEDRLGYTKEYILFFDKDTFLNCPCDTIKKYKWYQKRELTIDYLNANDWVITYP